MHISVESLEQRTLFSTGFPSNANLVILNPPGDSTADTIARQRIVVALETPSGKIIRDSRATKVFLRDATGSADTIVGSGRLSHGKAVIRNLTTTLAGTHAIDATSLNLTSRTSAQFVVSTGATAKLVVTGVAGVPFSGQAAFEAKLFDAFGNPEPSDASYVYLFNNAPDSLIGIDYMTSPTTGVPVFSPAGTFAGLQFVNGVADFTVQAGGGPRSVSVVFADSNPKVNHVQSFSWLAHM